MLFNIDFGQSDSKLHIRHSSMNKVETFSFRQLYEDSQLLIEQLNAVQLPPRCRVGLLAKNSYRWLVWDIALLSSGRAPVIFTDDFFAKAADDLISEFQLTLLVSDHSAEPNSLHININDDFEKIATEWQAKVDDADVLSLVFSSGSSGNLKGLTISKAGFEHDVCTFRRMYQLESQDCMLTFLPLSNNQQRLLYWACLLGNSNILITHVNAAYLDSVAFRPTFVIAPPSYYENLLRIAAATSANANASNNMLPRLVGDNLRFCITGMAPIAKNVLKSLTDLGLPIFEVYGQTELGVITANTPGDNKIGTLGKPIDGVILHLSEGNELVVEKTPRLTLNYFQASDEDIKNTFIENNRVATGDIVEMDGNGRLSIKGRKKDGVITRSGEKFQPNDMEKLIEAHPEVLRAIIINDSEGSIFAALFCEENRVETREAISSIIKEINSAISPNRQIKKWDIFTVPLTVENGLLTRNQKINRPGIKALVVSTIEASRKRAEAIEQL